MSKRSSVKPDDYHLVDLMTGKSYGGFVSLEAARIEACWERLMAWQIWHGATKVEHHDPDRVAPGSVPPVAFPDRHTS